MVIVVPGPLSLQYWVWMGYREHYIEPPLHLEVSKSTLTNVEGDVGDVVVIVMAPPPSKIVVPLQ